MIARGAPTALDRSIAQRCPVLSQRQSLRSTAPAATDRPARKRSAAARRHPLPDARICGGKVSFLNPPSAARLRVRAPWQAHGEHGAFAWLARHRHVATHHTRELAREGKAKPRAAEALRGRGIRLSELLEQL